MPERDDRWDRRTTLEFPDRDLKWKLREIAARRKQSLNQYILTAVFERAKRDGEKLTFKDADNAK